MYLFSRRAKLLTAVLFFLVGNAQTVVFSFFFKVAVVLDGFASPLWASAVGVLIP